MIIFAMLLCFIPIVAFVGCDKLSVTKQEQVGELQTTIEKGDTLDTSGIIMRYTLSDSTTFDVTADMLEFGDVDTSIIGTQKLVITYVSDEYGTVEYKIDIKIEGRAGVLGTCSNLDTGIKFNPNKTYLYSDDNQPVETSFADKEQIMVVGDDNPFDMLLEAMGYDEKGDIVNGVYKLTNNLTTTTDDYDLDIELKIKTAEGYEVATFADYATIDAVYSTIDFNESAIGHEFELTVSVNPAKRDAEITNPEVFSTKYSFKVVDGYNVYDPRELSLYDNCHAGWAQIKADMGLTNVSTNAFVFQKDISITKDDVRADVFWTADAKEYNTIKDKTTEEVIGTPINEDHEGIYYRYMTGDSQFAIYGNYYNLSVADFPRAVGGGRNFSRAVNIDPNDPDNNTYSDGYLALFYAIDVNANNSKTLGMQTTTNNAKQHWENIHFVGNAPESADPRCSGGLILMKDTGVTFEGYNTVSQNCYISYFFLNRENQVEGSDNLRPTYTLDSVKAYNSFQTLVYLQGAEQVKIINSEFKGSAGPGFIVDDRESHGVVTYPVHLDLIETTIVSNITGQEPWFAMYGATSMVMKIPGIDELINNPLIKSENTVVTGSVIDSKGVKHNKVNLALIYKNDTYNITSAQVLGGYVRSFKSMAEYDAYYDPVDPVLTGTYGLSSQSVAWQKALGNCIYVESNTSGGYANEKIMDETTPYHLDTSFICMTYAGLNQVLNGIYATLMEYGVTLADLYCSDADFAAKNEVEQVDSINARLQILYNTDDATAGAYNLLNAFYDNATSHGLKKAISGFNVMTLEQKYQALTLEHTESVRYDDGDYLNIYLPQGMCAMLGMTKRPVAE